MSGTVASGMVSACAVFTPLDRFSPLSRGGPSTSAVAAIAEPFSVMMVGSEREKQKTERYWLETSVQSENLFFDVKILPFTKLIRFVDGEKLFALNGLKRNIYCSSVACDCSTPLSVSLTQRSLYYQRIRQYKVVTSYNACIIWYGICAFFCIFRRSRTNKNLII